MLVLESFILTIGEIIREHIIPAILFALLMLYIRYRAGKKNNIGCFFFYLYFVLIYGATILSRVGAEKVITKDFLGIKQLFENPWYVVSFIENIFMFVLFGILFVIAFHGTKAQCLKWALVVSLSIELLQGIFHLGEAQIIDLCSNVLGAFLGWIAMNKIYSWKWMNKHNPGE